MVCLGKTLAPRHTSVAVLSLSLPVPLRRVHQNTEPLPQLQNAVETLRQAWFGVVKLGCWKSVSALEREPVPISLSPAWPRLHTHVQRLHRTKITLSIDLLKRPAFAAAQKANMLHHVSNALLVWVLPHPTKCRSNSKSQHRSSSMLPTCNSMWAFRAAKLQAHY